jgi:hypothetical protein
MPFEGKSRRVRERVPLSLPVRVVCRESKDYEWVEMSRLIDVTPFGARFAITRPTEPGRLMYLTMPMPRQLRYFDHIEDQYRVWAMVRNVTCVAPLKNQTMRFEVGVAFVGKRAPSSFEADPGKRYEIARTASEATSWKLLEDADRMVTQKTGSDLRVDTRHDIPITVLVEVIDQDGKIGITENTVTENISKRGTSVFTTLEVDGGCFVRLSSDQHGVSVLAVVRGRRPGPDGVMRLHLEFVDRDWPLGEGAE